MNMVNCCIESQAIMQNKHTTISSFLKTEAIPVMDLMVILPGRGGFEWVLRKEELQIG